MIQVNFLIDHVANWPIGYTNVTINIKTYNCKALMPHLCLHQQLHSTECPDLAWMQSHSAIISRSYICAPLNVVLDRLLRQSGAPDGLSYQNGAPDCASSQDGGVDGVLS